MAHLYLREELEDSEVQLGSVLSIVGDEARHATRVSRIRVGERTSIGNGRGVAGEGPVLSSEKDRLTIRVETVRREDEPDVTLTLVQALAKGDRAERAVEQATEFGVDRIIPWQAARSISRWSGDERSEKSGRGVAKWQKVAREAAKQSMRLRVPVVDALVGTKQVCEFAAMEHIEVIVLHPEGRHTLREWGTTRLEVSVGELMVVVGPEGGLSSDELEALDLAGARILRLGSPILRTSSAGPAALAVLNVALERW